MFRLNGSTKLTRRLRTSIAKCYALPSTCQRAKFSSSINDEDGDNSSEHYKAAYIDKKRSQANLSNLAEKYKNEQNGEEQSAKSRLLERKTGARFFVATAETIAKITQYFWQNSTVLIVVVVVVVGISVLLDSAMKSKHSSSKRVQGPYSRYSDDEEVAGVEYESESLVSRLRKQYKQ